SLFRYWMRCWHHILKTLLNVRDSGNFRRAEPSYLSAPPLSDIWGIRKTIYMYKPIENYGLIGNMHSAALVGMDGAIDWFCFPHFDSPSIFGALLDEKRGGCFRIAPDQPVARTHQYYWPQTNVLVTRFLLADGSAEVTDFMPVVDS